MPTALLSHALRTPLNAIEGYTEGLLGGDVGRIDSDARDSLREVRAAARRLRSLADLLEAGRTQSDSGKSVDNGTQIGESIRSLAGGFRWRPCRSREPRERLVAWLAVPQELGGALALAALHAVSHERATDLIVEADGDSLVFLPSISRSGSGDEALPLYILTELGERAGLRVRFDAGGLRLDALAVACALSGQLTLRRG